MYRNCCAAYPFPEVSVYKMWFSILKFCFIMKIHARSTFFLALNLFARTERQSFAVWVLRVCSDCRLVVGSSLAVADTSVYVLGNCTGWRILLPALLPSSSASWACSLGASHCSMCRYGFVERGALLVWLRRLQLPTLRFHTADTENWSEVTAPLRDVSEWWLWQEVRELAYMYKWVCSIQMTCSLSPTLQLQKQPAE